MKKISVAIISAIVLAFLLSSCWMASEYHEYSKYTRSYLNLFDTYSEFTAYAKSEKEFEGYNTVVFEKLKDLDSLYSIYDDVEGVVNLKTVNDNAGIEPVKVSREIIRLLKFGKEVYRDTNGVVDISIGPVSKIWHDLRIISEIKPEAAELPTREELLEAEKLCNIDDVIIDEQASTVFLKKKGMRLDVGAIAKGFTEDIAMQFAKQYGLESALLNFGGNIAAVNGQFHHVDENWLVGVQDPKKTVGPRQNIIDVLTVNGMCLATSGSYTRFFELDGVLYSHIIDPNTLMPAELYDQVTVVCEEAKIADMLSTALFLVDVETGKELLKKNNAVGIWVFPDGSVEVSEGYSEISQNY